MPPRSKANKRRRNKSSPGWLKSTKKYKVASGSDSGEESEYFEPLDFSEIDTDTETTPSPSQSSNMGTLSESDIDRLAEKLAPMLIPKIILSLRHEFAKEIDKLVNEKMAFMGDAVNELKKENETLRNDLSETRRELDDLQQYGRRMNLNISNIPGDTGDSSENVKAKIVNHAKDCGVALCDADIDRCHRRGSPRENFNRKVIIRFSNSTARDRIYMSRKSFGEGIYVQEDLTPFREKLGFEARQLVRAGTLVKTWIAGCKIKADLPDKKGTIQIRDMKDINRLKGDLLPV